MEAFNRGDVEAILAMLDRDVEVFSHADTGNEGRYRGHDGYLLWLESWLEAWDEFRIEVREVEPVDDETVLAITDQAGRGQGSGVVVTRGGITFAFTIREGLVTRIGLYLDRETALGDLPDAER